VRRTLGLLRLLVAVGGLVALVANFLYTLGFSAFSSANYFAYFTQQSNTANVVVLVVAGVTALRGRPEPRWFAGVHALVSTYVIVSGIVYGVIVAESASHSYTMEVPWSSQVLHWWIPTFVLVDWVLAPGRTRVGWWVMAVVPAYPLVWGVATIVRGAEVGWYPYFFLDPAQVAWPDEYVAYNALALAVIVGVLAGLVALSRLRPDVRLARFAEGQGMGLGLPPSVPSSPVPSSSPLAGAPGSVAPGDGSATRSR